MATSMTMEDHAENCKICLLPYDCTSRRLHHLPCGHGFCTSCMDGIQQQGMATCPTCHVRHLVPEAGQFPVNPTAEALPRVIGNLTLNSPSPNDTADPEEKRLAELGSVARSLLQQYSTDFQDAVEASVEIHKHLLPSKPAGCPEGLEYMYVCLRKLQEQSQKVRKLIQQEGKWVSEKMHQVQELQDMLQEERRAII